MWTNKMKSIRRKSWTFSKSCSSLAWIEYRFAARYANTRPNPIYFSVLANKYGLFFSVAFIEPRHSALHPSLSLFLSRFLCLFGARDSTCTVKCAFRMHLKWYHGTKAAAAYLMFFDWARIEQWALNGKAIASTEHTHTLAAADFQKTVCTYKPLESALTMCMCFSVCIRSPVVSSALTLRSLGVCLVRCGVLRSLACLPMYVYDIYFNDFDYVSKRYRNAMCVCVAHRAHREREPVSQAASQPSYNTAHRESFQ